ncbi:MAG: hypothetical protein JST00_30255 [Deltaproteobacteria bacterium]|nr:hypothetical protein [Deltaproteobacteria bacterium]
MIKASHGPSRRSDDGEAFVPDPRTAGRANAADAEFFAEEFLASATSGENVEQDASDEVTPEEYGGPFLEETLADLDDDLVDTLPEPPTLKAP